MIQLRNSTSGQTAWFPKITKETVDSYTKTESDARYVKKDDYSIDKKDIDNRIVYIEGELKRQGETVTDNVKEIADLQTEIADIPTEFKTINGETIVGQGDIEIRATVDSGSDLTVNTITTASGNVDTRIANNYAAINTVANQSAITYRKISDSYSKSEVYTKSETYSEIDTKINNKIWTGTQSEYDNIPVKVSSTIYVITE